MNAKQLLLSLVVLSTLMLGGIRQAFAQEDESWYKQRPKAQQQKKVLQSSISRSEQKQVTTNQRTACDFVINGDMETQVNAPSYTGNMGGGGRRDPFTGYTNTPDQLADWYSPTLGTPDFLATNAVNTVQGNDVNPALETRVDGRATVTGSSSVHSGIGEIGLYSRQAPANDPNDIVSEYATTKITPTLPNVSYYAEMWVSLSHSTLSCNYGIDTDFGMWFTPNDNFKQLDNRFYLKKPTSQFISNSSPIAEGDINNGTLGATNWKRISGILRGNGENYVTIGAFNPVLKSQPLQGKNRNNPNTYVFVDDFQLYKIPTTGSTNLSMCRGSSVTLGEGCPIPGATYTWTAPGLTGLPTRSTNISLTTSPTTTTTYTLTVNLPDQTTYSTSATVTVSIVEMPKIVVDEVHTDRCQQYIGYVITNFNKDFTYTVNILSGRVNALPVNPTTNQFRIKGGSRITGGSFSVTVSCGGSTFTTSEYFADFDCASNREASTLTAYPNPATESVTLPKGVNNATLLDNNGKPVKSSSKSAKFDLQGIPDGLYNLQMMQDGKLINQRIQIKH